MYHKPGLPEVDIYEFLEPRLMRPAMYMGKKNIHSLSAYIMGVMTLAWDSLGNGPQVFNLVSDPDFEEFHTWVRKKYNFAPDEDRFITWDVTILEVEREHGGDDHAEERAVDRFVEDLRHYKNRHPLERLAEVAPNE